MTWFVKIFQIKRIVPDLINIGFKIFFFSNLKLNNKYNISNNYQAIHSFPHSWDGKFKKKSTIQTIQCTFQHRNLMFPRLILICI